MEDMLNKIIKYGLYSLVFLLPLFFLPWTIFPVILNKQMLLSAFVFLLLILWAAKVIGSGKLSFVWNRLTSSVILLLLVLGVSTFFSTSRIQSFWGMSFEPDTFFSFILYILVFLFFSNLISENQLSSVLISFLAGSGIISLLFLIQIFKPVFPWDFTQVSGFNPIGSVQSLAVFLGGAFVILLAIITGKPTLKRLNKCLLFILGVLLFISILLINFWIVWLGIALGSGIIIFHLLKNISKNQPSSAETSGPAGQDNLLKPLFLPLFIFVLALVFIFLKLPIGNIISLPSEVTPTYKATIDISIRTLKEGSKNLILGSGPATFGYQYSLHRGTGPNFTDFWQVRFDQGTAALPTFLVTFGTLGILVILLMMAIFFWQGFTRLSFAGQNFGGFAAFLGGFYFLVFWIFYSANLSLLFAAFLMMGLWTAISINQPNQHKSALKEFSFAQSPQKAFFTMLVCVILIVGSILGIYTISQKYLAAVNYSQGLGLINAEEPKLNEGIIKINKAVQFDPKDIYFRNLSQAFLLKVNEVLNNQELTQEEKQKLFQQVVSNAELSASAAVQINPKNSQNWLQLGSVYENLASVNIEGAGDLAILNYQKAAELDPQNPLIPFNLGRVYKISADKIVIQIVLLEQAEEKDEEAIKKLQESYEKNLGLVLEQLGKSVNLKSNFTPAYYLMAQVYEAKGEKEKALENYQIVLQLEPSNTEVAKKIEELKK